MLLPLKRVGGVWAVLESTVSTGGVGSCFKSWRQRLMEKVGTFRLTFVQRYQNGQGRIGWGGERG